MSSKGPQGRGPSVCPLWPCWLGLAGVWEVAGGEAECLSISRLIFSLCLALFICEKTESTWPCSNAFPGALWGSKM